MMLSQVSVTAFSILHCHRISQEINQVEKLMSFMFSSEEENEEKKERKKKRRTRKLFLIANQRD
jgi:hypothetical protein